VLRWCDGLICFEFKLNSGTDDQNKLPAEFTIS